MKKSTTKKLENFWKTRHFRKDLALKVGNEQLLLALSKNNNKHRKCGGSSRTTFSALKKFLSFVFKSFSPHLRMHVRDLLVFCFWDVCECVTLRQKVFWTDSGLAGFYIVSNEILGTGKMGERADQICQIFFSSRAFEFWFTISVLKDKIF